MKALYIPITRGLQAIVDEQDYDYLSQFNWHANQQSQNFYAARLQEKVMMHHVVWCRAGGMMKRGLYIDHINRNTLDNRRLNLRQVTPAINAVNSRKHHELVGITFRGEEFDYPWRVRLQLEKQRLHIGVYRTKDEAITALMEAKNAHAN